jgi:hypothetical protein
MAEIGRFYGHLAYFTAISVSLMAIWYILWSFWYIFPVLVSCAKKNLATLFADLASRQIQISIRWHFPKTVIDYFK